MANMLRTSGFLDDVMFLHYGANRPETNTARAFRPVGQAARHSSGVIRCFVEFATWRQRAWSLLFPTASCLTFYWWSWIGPPLMTAVRYCISSFVDDVIFPYNGAVGQNQRQSYVWWVFRQLAAQLVQLLYIARSLVLLPRDPQSDEKNWTVFCSCNFEFIWILCWVVNSALLLAILYIIISSRVGCKLWRSAFCLSARWHI